MYFGSQDQLLARATEICFAPDGAYARFRTSTEELGQAINAYLTKMGAPEDEKNLLVGHYGLFGETGNSISQILLNLRDDLSGGSEKDTARGLNRIFLLSTLENYGSQYSHRSPDARENVIAACNRIIAHIGRWADEHAEEIEPADRIKILGLRHNFAVALDEIYDFMQAARPCFQIGPATPGAPAATL